VRKGWRMESQWRTDSLCRAPKTPRGKEPGRCPGPRHGGSPPETPRPLSLLSDVPERSSPSRVCCGKSFQNQKRFSSAAHKRRALDRSGPFRKPGSDKGKGANAKSKPSTLEALHASRWSALGYKKLRHKDKPGKETQGRSLRSSPGSFFNEKMLPPTRLIVLNLMLGMRCSATTSEPRPSKR
jgi:hypothetical protein